MYVKRWENKRMHVCGRRVWVGAGRTHIQYNGHIYNITIINNSKLGLQVYGVRGIRICIVPCTMHTCGAWPCTYKLQVVTKCVPRLARLFVLATSGAAISRCRLCSLFNFACSCSTCSSASSEGPAYSSSS